jgi:hypothetical protein
MKNSIYKDSPFDTITWCEDKSHQDVRIDCLICLETDRVPIPLSEFYGRVAE